MALGHALEVKLDLWDVDLDGCRPSRWKQKRKRNSITRVELKEI